MNFHTEALWREAKAHVDMGMSPSRVISALTQVGARILGKSQDLGTIEPGKLADIIVVDGDPEYDILALSHVEVVVKGGREPTGLDAVDWARRGVELGAGEILLTSMDRDGTKDGFDLELTRSVAEAVEVPVIASGGAGTAEHCAEAVVEGKASAVLAASIFHRREVEISAVKAAMAAAGAPVRMVSR